uniref:WXG100 family type VII secretion target n=1 Tax=Eubacterium cellulosolvens TaxID=29322 RepID=UPI00048594E7|nr:WXG100 family type VII secretion target [[Eubacterium] cellulosolvens]
MFRLKVSGETMRERASEAEDQIREMEKTFQKMQEILQDSKAYWTGSGGDACRKSGKDCCASAVKTCKKLFDSVQALRIMTDVYEQTEAEAHGLASGLSTGEKKNGV